MNENMEGWVGPGNEATTPYYGLYVIYHNAYTDLRTWEISNSGIAFFVIV